MPLDTKKSRKQFFTKDIKFVKENKDKLTYREMALLLGHPKYSIGKFARRHAGMRNKMSK